MTLIKLCGLNTAQAVDAASALAPDFAGFVTHPASPRHVTPAQAGVLKARLAPGIRSIAVMVNPDDVLLEEIMRDFAPHGLQLHDVDAARLGAIRARYGIFMIHAIRVQREEDIAQSASDADMLLFDAASPGSGKKFDWQWLAGRSFSLPWLLSGGLTGGNVLEALRVTHAPGVDVSSGIESAPGVKDAAKMAAFMRAAREAKRE